MAVVSSSREVFRENFVNEKKYLPILLHICEQQQQNSQVSLSYPFTVRSLSK